MSDRHFFNGRLPGSRSRNGDGAASHLFGGVSQRLMTSRHVRQNIVSLVGLIGAPVLNQSGEEVGRLVDMVAQVHGNTDPYPALTGIVVRVGRRRAFLDASAIDRVERRSVTLRTARLDLREFHRREGEVLLHRDILDHQLVDTDEVQVIRAADLYLAQIGEQVQLGRGREPADAAAQASAPSASGLDRLHERSTGPRSSRWRDSPEAPAHQAARAELALRRRRPPSWTRWRVDRPGPRSRCPARPRTSSRRPGGDERTKLTARRARPAAQAAELSRGWNPTRHSTPRANSSRQRAGTAAHMPTATERTLTACSATLEDEASGVMNHVLRTAHPDETVSRGANGASCQAQDRCPPRRRGRRQRQGHRRRRRSTCRSTTATSLST